MSPSPADAAVVPVAVDKTVVPWYHRALGPWSNEV